MKKRVVIESNVNKVFGTLDANLKTNVVNFKEDKNDAGLVGRDCTLNFLGKDEIDELFMTNKVKAGKYTIKGV